jgi:hypothetical protein
MKVKVPVKVEVEVPIQRITPAQLLERVKPFEEQYGLTSAEFLEQFKAGTIEETRETVEWYILCRTYFHAIQRETPASEGHSMNTKVLKKVEVEIPFQQITVDDIADQLKQYEQKYGMTTEEFHQKFTAGMVPETREMVEWHLEYRLYLHVMDQRPYGS